MLFESKEEIRACVKDNKVCKYLVGCLEIEPILVSCRMGNNCKVASCRFYIEE